MHWPHRPERAPCPWDVGYRRRVILAGVFVKLALTLAGYGLYRLFLSCGP